MYENTISEILKAQTDKEELGKIVENNSGLVWSIVKRFRGRGYENEDLFQIGNIGLIKAIKNFNPEYEVKLSTYAVTYIIGEIKKFIRDDGIIKVSRSIKELCVKIKDIDAIARGIITDAGYGDYFPHRLGHGLGLEEHEYQDVSSTNTNEFVPGMVVTVEPGIYVPGIAGVRIEDDILVTENGNESMTGYEK